MRCRNPYFALVYVQQVLHTQHNEKQSVSAGLVNENVQKWINRNYQQQQQQQKIPINSLTNPALSLSRQKNKTNKFQANSK